jgi:hypothetical protein
VSSHTGEPPSPEHWSIAIHQIYDVMSQTSHATALSDEDLK